MGWGGGTTKINEKNYQYAGGAVGASEVWGCVLRMLGCVRRSSTCIMSEVAAAVYNAGDESPGGGGGGGEILQTWWVQRTESCSCLQQNSAARRVLDAMRTSYHDVFGPYSSIHRKKEKAVNGHRTEGTRVVYLLRSCTGL